MNAVRSIAALLVVLVLVGGVVVAAEWFARRQVDAVVTDVVRRQLVQGGAEGDGELQDVQAAVQGSALLGLLTGRFDAMTVTTGAGVVQGVPVRGVDVLAQDVTTDGTEAAALTATVRVEAAPALQSQLPEELGQTVLSSTVALPPDRLQVQAPYEVPVLGTVPVQVELLLRVADGTLVVEPVQAQAAGVDLDLSQQDAFPSVGVGEDLPEGFDVTAVQVVDEDGTAVVVADVSCSGGCPLVGLSPAG